MTRKIETNATILAVDDTPDNLDIVRAVLKESQHRVLCAVNGEVALRLAEEKSPDLILLDVMMPNMDGHEVCRRLKANPETCDIPVIFLTALTDARDERIGLELGAVDYIAKPISPPILTARVNTHLSLKRALDAMALQNKRLENEVHERQRAQAEVADSIRYASRIQQATLPSDKLFQAFLGDYFHWWQPRDVVGGDLYWARRWGDGLLLALGDCTGHGVPGALMTMVVSGAIDRALQSTPAGSVGALLAAINQSIKDSLGQHDLSEGHSDDGLEMGACFITVASNELTFAGGRFDLFKLSAGEVEVISGVRKSLGYRSIPYDQTYPQVSVEVAPGDAFYMSSDGLFDQIGAQAKRGFGKRRWRELIIEVATLPSMAQQQQRMAEIFNTFRGDEAPRDDLSVLGFVCRQDEPRSLFTGAAEPR
ncbi:MAG: response regulator [Gammaproteobacteria bacterium]|nr:response regulator [Gammaproteobacteria bacterium]